MFKQPIVLLMQQLSDSVLFKVYIEAFFTHHFSNRELKMVLFMNIYTCSFLKNGIPEIMFHLQPDLFIDTL